MYVCVYIRMYVCVCIYICTCVYIYTYIYGGVFKYFYWILTWKASLTSVNAAAEAEHWEPKQQEMHLVSKVNRTQVFSAEIPRKLRGWLARRRCVYMQHIGDSLEVWSREFAWLYNIPLYNQGSFDLNQKRFHRRIVPQLLCVSLNSLSLSHSTHPYILDNKSKRKEADYVFIHQLCRLSLLNNITCWS